MSSDGELDWWVSEYTPTPLSMACCSQEDVKAMVKRH